MSEQLVITALGADRPGIVDELSNTLFSRQLNIEDSRMSVLGGEFAILLLVSGDKKNIDDFIAQQPQIENTLQMQLTVKATTTQADSAALLAYDIEVESIDHPGIVHKLASFFSSRKINIVDLETDRYPAPHTGTSMFSLHMTIGLPADYAVNALRDEFLVTCDELNLDAKFSTDNEVD